MVLGICLFIFAFNLFMARGELSQEGHTLKVVLETFMVAVSLAVAAIPEGLATVVTAITIISYIIGHCMEVGCFEMPRGISPDGMTMAFLTMSMCEIFHSFNMRSQRKSVFSLKGQNKILWIAMIGSLILTTLILEVPFLANAFGFEMISWTEYAIAIALAFLVIPIVEIVRFFQRKAVKK